MLTSFFGTAPGGLSAIPGIAEEVGANTAVVSIIQTMRVFLVVFTVPIIVSSLAVHTANPTIAHNGPASGGIPNFEINQLFWTIVLVVVQVLRVIMVCMILPPFFKLLNRRRLRKNVHSQASA